ncbi:MAG: WYL domain-containing protein [Candidatus Margulisbacteria bacterium]|nr:WYL domain-containing protein [Candidatus Margulisiibacteriota bacterium]
MKIFKIFEVIKALKEEQLSIEELSNLCSVSEKTIYRYIRNLRDNGFVIKKSFGKYSIISVKNSDEKTFCEKCSQEFDLKVINRLRDSCCGCHKIKFNYLSPRYEKKFQVEAFCVDIIEIRKRYYLVGYDMSDKVFKEYRLDRMSELRIFPEINQNIKSKLIKISFFILPELAKHYEGQFDDYEVIDLLDGTKKVNMQIHSFFRAKKILFSYLEQIKIIEPKEFAEDCLRTLKEMTKNYCLKN